MNWNKRFTFCAILLILSLWGCKYRLDGITIPPTIKTVSIAYINNVAPIVAPDLSPMVTDKLRNKFLTQTNLQLIERGGDFDITGAIVNYAVAPVGAANNSTASVNRLTITMSITMASEVEPTLAFEKSYTQFEDFDASKNLSEVESTLIESISDKLVQEVFNQITLNW